MKHQRSLFAFAVLGIAACSTVLDIEDLESGPNPASGGSGGSGGRASGGQAPGDGGAAEPSGGRPAGSGGSSAGTSSGGVAPATGGTAGTTGSGGKAMAGETGEAGAGAGEGGGSSGPGTVTGTVIDFWKHPLANVPLQIGTTTGVTDSDGKFSVADVTPPYDISLRIETERLAYGWVYLGVTRLDPTLQVDSGAQERSSSISFYADNAEFDVEDTVGLAVGTPDGSYSGTIGSTGSNPFPSWVGPATTTATIHALWWTQLADADAPGPDSYRGYATQTGMFTDGGKAEFTLDLAATTVQSRLIQGTVQRSLDESPENVLFLRFVSNGVIELSRDSAEGANFAYTAPVVPGSEVVVAASQGDVFNGPYGVAHVVATGPTVSLTPPQPVTVIGPAPDSINVGPTTMFQWTEQPGVRVLHLEDSERFRGLYVVTTQNQVTLPPVVGGFQLRPNVGHTWTVEVHGTADTMDEATGTEGFLDSFSWVGDEPRGPRGGDGTYSSSQTRYLTTAP